MAQTSASGRAGSVTIASVAIAITKWDATVNKELADSTDSSTFDPTSGQLFASQVPGVVSMEGTLEGNFDLAGSTSTSIIQRMKADGLNAIVFKISSTVPFASGNFDLTSVDITVSVPGATMTTFSAKFKSNGIFTLN